MSNGVDLQKNHMLPEIDKPTMMQLGAELDMYKPCLF